MASTDPLPATSESYQEAPKLSPPNAVLTGNTGTGTPPPSCTLGADTEQTPSPQEGLSAWSPPAVSAQQPRAHWGSSPAAIPKLLPPGSSTVGSAAGSLVGSRYVMSARLLLATGTGISLKTTI